MNESSNRAAGRYIKLRKKAKTGRCMYVDADGERCRNKSIGSHTVQNSGALKAISENGHVYRMHLDALRRASEPPLEFTNTGKSKASVFPGFCKKHDNDLFSDIEGNSPELSKWAIFLLTYRVICRELFAKEHNVRVFTDPVLVAEAKIKGTSEYFENFLKGTLLGLTDLKRMKSEYETALRTHDLSSFKATCFILESTLPFCMATTFAPEFDFNGNSILPGDEDRWDAIGAFSGRFGDKNIVSIGGFTENRQHDISSFISTFSEVSMLDVGDIALNIALEFSDNAFYRKSWIDDLTSMDRQRFLKKFEEGVPGIISEDTRQIHKSMGYVNIAAVDLMVFENP